MRQAGVRVLCAVLFQTRVWWRFYPCVLGDESQDLVLPSRSSRFQWRKDLGSLGCCVVRLLVDSREVLGCKEVGKSEVQDPPAEERARISAKMGLCFSLWLQVERNMSPGL